MALRLQIQHLRRAVPEQRRYACMRHVLLFCALLLTCTGCPKAPYMHRTVALKLPPSSAQTSITLSAQGTEVQEALSVINNALMSKGFLRVTNPPEAAIPGFLAGYSTRSTNGLVPLGAPIVWLKDDRLEVVFGEGRRGVSGPLSAETRQTADFLKQELIAHYGKKRVSVHHGPA